VVEEEAVVPAASELGSRPCGFSFFCVCLESTVEMLIDDGGFLAGRDVMGEEPGTISDFAVVAIVVAVVVVVVVTAAVVGIGRASISEVDALDSITTSVGTLEVFLLVSAVASVGSATVLELFSFSSTLSIDVMSATGVFSTSAVDAVISFVES
jgi:hypothetical protein